MLRFVGNDLRLVLAEAKANRCRVILVKDHGVYIMSEIGVSNEQGQRKLLAYAVGCNPDKDDFDQWWELAPNLVVMTSENISTSMTHCFLVCWKVAMTLLSAPPTHICILKQ